MQLWAASVVLRRRDNSMSVNCNYVLIKIYGEGNPKRSHENLVNALRFADTPDKEPSKWVIKDIILIKQLGV